MLCMFMFNVKTIVNESCDIFLNERHSYNPMHNSKRILLSINPAMSSNSPSHMRFLLEISLTKKDYISKDPKGRVENAHHP